MDKLIQMINDNNDINDIRIYCVFNWIYFYNHDYKGNIIKIKLSRYYFKKSSIGYYFLYNYQMIRNKKNIYYEKKYWRHSNNIFLF